MKPRPRKLSDVEAVEMAIGRAHGWDFQKEQAKAAIACLRRRGWRKVKGGRDPWRGAAYCYTGTKK